jgi:hypothetical protein
MSPVAVARVLTENGKLKLEVKKPTNQEMEEHPEHAIGALVHAIWLRSFEITHSEDSAELPDGFVKFFWDWVYAEPQLTRRAGLELALQQNNLWDVNVAEMRIRKRGRQIKSRHMAIKALFRKVYLNKTWKDVTLSLCQCGKSHDDKLTLKMCQGNVESGARQLKAELKKYGIAFPPVFKADEPPVSVDKDLLKIATLEESSGVLRVPDKHAQQHPAIAILLDGEPLPVIPMDGDESAALSLFNPWVKGWVPLWFPSMIIRGSEPIRSVYLDSEQRYIWFDKTFKKFAGSDWQLRGDLDSKRLVIARTLLQMYRAARDEELPDLADL